MLKLTGYAVLVLGLVVAGLVYWHGTRSKDLSDDPAMTAYNKAEARDMGMLYGNEGVLMDDCFKALKQPGTQAILIIAGSVVVAAGCFLLVRFPERDDD